MGREGGTIGNINWERTNIGSEFTDNVFWTIFTYPNGQQERISRSRPERIAHIYWNGVFTQEANSINDQGNNTAAAIQRQLDQQAAEEQRRRDEAIARSIAEAARATQTVAQGTIDAIELADDAGGAVVDIAAQSVESSTELAGAAIDQQAETSQDAISLNEKTSKSAIQAVSDSLNNLKDNNKIVMQVASIGLAGLAMAFLISKL